MKSFYYRSEKNKLCLEHNLFFFYFIKAFKKNVLVFKVKCLDILLEMSWRFIFTN